MDNTIEENIYITTFLNTVEERKKKEFREWNTIRKINIAKRGAFTEEEKLIGKMKFNKEVSDRKYKERRKAGIESLRIQKILEERRRQLNEEDN